jgi:hypothetical protein
MTSKDLQTLLGQYEAAAVRQGSEKTAPAANAAAEELSTIYRELRSRGREAVESLLPLLKHPNASVRCWAAAHTLEFAPEEATAALEALATGAPGAMRATASMTLREWRAGRLRFP